jgi:signal transduction histidine kinase
MMKKKKLLDLSRQYLAGLRQHLLPGPRATTPNKAALRLGQGAVALGLETLDLARIHEQALTQLETNTGRSFRTKSAERFFTEANRPIEETHHAAQQTQRHLRNLQESLQQRTQELAVTNRRLQRGVVRRKTMEAAFAKSGQHHRKCLEESLQLQKRLRQLTHRVLAAQEADRQSISQTLQDEIAQTLLGINVRLLSLQRESRRNTAGLQNEIASTQRLVVKSVRSVRRVAREFGSL